MSSDDEVRVLLERLAARYRAELDTTQGLDRLRAAFLDETKSSSSSAEASPAVDGENLNRDVDSVAPRGATEVASNSASGMAADEDVVRRLRELYDGADEEDRPRAALYLGLALADHVAGLTAGHPRRGELAEEGLARLAEAADDSPAAVAAAERLESCLPAIATQGPASFRFGGGDLNWDLDWAALRGPAEAGRNLAAMLPFLATMLPPQDPTRDALLSIKEALDAFERGQWTPEEDAVLSSAIEQVEISGLGAGTGLILRVIAMMVRMQRCQQVLKDGGQPDWPSLAELDRLIDGLESASDLAAGLGPPFGAIEGLHHVFIASVVMMRIQVSYRAPGARQDAAWRDGTLRLLDQADDHLRQAPPAYAGMMQPLRGRLAGMSAALSGVAMPPGEPVAPPAPELPPAPPPEPSAASVVPESAARAGAASPDDLMAWLSSPSISQLSPQVLSGLQAMGSPTGGPTPIVLKAMLLANEAVNARKWDPGFDGRLAELEAEADRLATADQPLPGRAMMAATLAVTHAVRSLQLSGSPRPAEHPSATDFTAVLAKTEAALELMDAAAASQPGMSDGLVSILHAQAAMVLVELSRLDVPRRAELLARARTHFDQLPAEMHSQASVLGDMSMLAQLIEGNSDTDDKAIKPVIDPDLDS